MSNLVDGCKNDGLFKVAIKDVLKVGENKIKSNKKICCNFKFI